MDEVMLEEVVLTVSHEMVSGPDSPYSMVKCLIFDPLVKIISILYL